MKRELTCIVCPVGCSLRVKTEEGKVIEICGNRCARGEKYAETECVNPQRTVTSTVRCDDGGLVSVKTDRPIPKDKVAECMKIINNSICRLPVSVGDVIIDNVFGSRVVATSNARRKG